jgi:hypothetical protein
MAAYGGGAALVPVAVVVAVVVLSRWRCYLRRCPGGGCVDMVAALLFAECNYI